MVWLPDGEKNLQDIFSHFDRVNERDKRTDRHTASRGKNCCSLACERVLIYSVIVRLHRLFVSYCPLVQFHYGISLHFQSVVKVAWVSSGTIS